MMMTMTSPTITYPSHTNLLLVVTISTYQSSPSIRTPLLSLLSRSHNSHHLFDSLIIIVTHLTFYLHCHSYDDYSFSTINQSMSFCFLCTNHLCLYGEANLWRGFLVVSRLIESGYGCCYYCKNYCYFNDYEMLRLHLMSNSNYSHTYCHYSIDYQYYCAQFS